MSKSLDYKILLKRDGQTQYQRMPQWLDPSRIPVDDKAKSDFYDFLKLVAQEIRFHDAETKGVNGTWEDFFNLSVEEIERFSKNRALPAHLALFESFWELYQDPRKLANQLTKRHLDFYYGDVLKLGKRLPIPDLAHVVFELKKNTPETLLKAGTYLLAGKDNSNVLRHYKLTHDIVVNRSQIEQLTSVFVDPINNNFVRFAPIANSLDGLGGVLDKRNPQWKAFGSPSLMLANIGFCFASDVLLMKEGSRGVTITLTLSSLGKAPPGANLTKNLFNINITGEKGWIGPKTVSPIFSPTENGRSQLVFTVNYSQEEPAVSAYNAEIHGNNFDTNYPIVQILINNQKSDFGYGDLLGAELVDAQIEVDVQGIKGIVVENDLGVLDAKKPFLPFGPTPEVNANFSIQYDEAFSKGLKAFSVDIEWKNVPAKKLGDYFSEYGSKNTNDDFTATASFKDGSNWEDKTSIVKLFNTEDAQAVTNWSFTNPAFPIKLKTITIPQINLTPVSVVGHSVQQVAWTQMAYTAPAYASFVTPLQLQISAIFTGTIVRVPKPKMTAMINEYKDIRKGKLNLRLRHGFLFREHREKYTKEIFKAGNSGNTPNLPVEPFAPEIQSIALNYQATTSKLNFDGTRLDDYLDQEIEFFHYGAFGQMREHAFTKSRHAHISSEAIKLLPEYRSEGNFYIGFSGLKAEDAVCILVQVANGSANPETPKVSVIWKVLCDNYWKPLKNEDFIFDTTNGFLTSGVIKVVIPREATTSNRMMSEGLLWLSAEVITNSDGVCNLVDIQTNGAITEFEDRGNDPEHLAQPLEAGTITKLELPFSNIKSVTQPFASFSGRKTEGDRDYYSRVSERLRHKQRTISNWDYERLILNQFPQIHKVKCINHASKSSFFAAGHVLIIVVPDLTNQNAVDPLRPKVDKGTLENIQNILTQHAGTWVKPHVSNPFYEPVKISVKIKLKKGFEFNYYEKVINQVIREFLSPWIARQSNNIHFEGKISQSSIVQLLENLEFVDFIADLKMFRAGFDGSGFEKQTTFVEASNPAAILVSHDQHEVHNY